MIHNHDRSGWFGASDTAKIMGHWQSHTFWRWWGEKLGLWQNHFTNRSMMAGTYYEHAILKSIGITQMDRQIKIRSLRLRVNLDGEEKSAIVEVKTHSKPEFVVIRPYWMQCQVQMFAAKKPCKIVAYRLLEEDYQNFFNPIDPKRITEHPIAFDKNFIESQYLPRLTYLAWCLKRRKTPNEADL